MNNQPENSATVNGNGDQGGIHSSISDAPLELQPGELLAVAQGYFAYDFSNPERRACPVQTELISLARSGQLPHDTLRAHLFGCSECFTIYRTAMNERPQLVATPTASARAVWRERMAAAFTLHSGFAAYVSVAALCLITFCIWMLQRDAEPSSSLTSVAQPQTPPAQVSPLASREATPQISPIAEPPPSQPKRDAVATPVTATVNIDLADYVALRDVTDTNQGGQKVITLEPVLTRLRLRLPEGSLPGVYSVTLTDWSNRVIIPLQALNSDGRKLNIDLDLRSSKAVSATLIIKHQGDVRADEYPVSLKQPLQD